MSDRRNRSLSIGFLLFLAVIVGLGVLIAGRAETAVLQSQSGEVTAASLDPNEPGFRAFTTPNETALVVHTAIGDAGAQLLSISLLTEADRGAGGSVITIPRTFVDPAGSGVPLGQMFSMSGVDAVVDELNSTLGIGFGEVVVLDAASWTALMVIDLPLSLTLREDLVQPVDPLNPTGATEIILAAGTRDFDLADVAIIAGHRNPGEPPLGVALRHQQIWTAWISQTAGADERPDLFTQETGFAALIGALASDEVSYRTIDTTTVAASNPAATLYQADSELIADLMAEIVPFPETTDAVDRPTVFLLDSSVGDADLLPVVSVVARSGGVVSIIGNGDGNGFEVKEVQLHDPAAAAVAAEIAERLGYPEPRTMTLEDAIAAITVVS